jgi:hypothetical protein
MTAASDWLPQVAGASAAFCAQAASVRARVNEPSAHSQAVLGLMGVVPLLDVGDQTIGLLATPDTAALNWPGVAATRGQALTIATDATTLLPQALARSLVRSSRTVRRLSTGWAAVAPSAKALHLELGGNPKSLEHVIAAGGSPQALKPFIYDGTNERGREGAFSSLCRDIDSSDAFKRFADWVDASVARQWLPLDYVGDGPWRRVVLCWVTRLKGRETQAPSPSLEDLLELVIGPSGVDGGVPPKPSWAVSPGRASGESTVLEATMQIDLYPSGEGDSMLRDLSQTILEAGSPYSGAAHIQVADVLAARGDPKRAWAALQAAAWWAARNTGSVPGPVVASARTLAEAHGWTDLLWVLEQDPEGQ